MTGLKDFVPPILWPALRRASGRRRGNAVPGKARSAVAMASEGSYRLDFQRVELDGSKYFVPQFAAHRPASRAVLQGELYEPQTHVLVERLLQYRPGSMIHAGTFFGDMLPSFSNACPSTLYAFEPVLESFILAKLCVEENQLDNVVLLNSALSSKIAPGKIDIGEENAPHRGGSSTLSNSGQRTSLLTIDSLSIRDLTLVQLDVEGHEVDALRGAEATIDATAPIILVEDNANTCACFLQTKSYALIGSIPGLGIWANSQNADATRAILNQV